MSVKQQITAVGHMQSFTLTAELAQCSTQSSEQCSIYSLLIDYLYCILSITYDFVSLVLSGDRVSQLVTSSHFCVSSAGVTGVRCHTWFTTTLQAHMFSLL